MPTSLTIFNLHIIISGDSFKDENDDDFQRRKDNIRTCGFSRSVTRPDLLNIYLCSNEREYRKTVRHMDTWTHGHTDTRTHEHTGTRGQ